MRACGRDESQGRGWGWGGAGQAWLHPCQLPHLLRSVRPAPCRPGGPGGLGGSLLAGSEWGRCPSCCRLTLPSSYPAAGLPSELMAASTWAGRCRTTQGGTAAWLPTRLALSVGMWTWWFRVSRGAPGCWAWGWGAGWGWGRHMGENLILNTFVSNNGDHCRKFTDWVSKERNSCNANSSE